MCLPAKDADGESTGILRPCARFIKYVNPAREPTRNDQTNTASPCQTTANRIRKYHCSHERYRFRPVWNLPSAACPQLTASPSLGQWALQESEVEIVA